MEELSRKCSGKWTAGRKKDKTERVIILGSRTREEIVKWNQKTTEIADRGETSGLPGLPSGLE